MLCGIEIVVITAVVGFVGYSIGKSSYKKQAEAE